MPSQSRRAPFRQTWLQLQPTKAATGYWVVTLKADNGRSIQQRLHCLILAAFCGPRPAGLLGCHKDDNKDNNVLDNLEWGTPKHNTATAFRNGKMTGRKGEAHHMAKLTDTDICKIKELRVAGATCAAIATQFGVGMTLIWKIVNNKNWTHVQ